MKICIVFVALAAIGPAWAQTPPILLEACNAMEPASKRLECLRAANGVGGSSSSATANRAATTSPQPLYAPSTARAAIATRHSHAGGQTCHVGPRGGTYTITASGRKNYSGC